MKLYKQELNLLRSLDIKYGASVRKGKIDDNKFIVGNMELLGISAISPSLELLETGQHVELDLICRSGSLWLLLPLELLLVEAELVLLLARLLDLLPRLLGVKSPATVVPHITMMDNVGYGNYSRDRAVPPFRSERKT